MSVPKKIILIIIDTLRADHLGCYGYGRNTSPAIDRISREGVLFKHAFSPCPITLASITSMLTSKYPSNHSVGFNQGGMLNTDADISLAEILRGRGYKTAGFVSTFVLRKSTGLNAGFDIYDDETPSHELNRPGLSLRDGLATAGHALKWVAEHKADDFFVMLHLMDVHGPYVCPEPYGSRFVGDGFGIDLRLSVVPTVRPVGGIPDYQVLRPERDDAGNLTGYERDAGYYVSQYDGNISRVDDIVARLADGLKELNIYDDCLLIIMSDHGESMGENNVYFFHGLTVTPDQISVPLIVKPHAGWNAISGAIETPVSSIDLMPTILSLCGYDHGRLALEGRTVKTLMEEGRDPALSGRVIMSENERQYALVGPGGTMEIRNKRVPHSQFCISVPELVDELDGRRYDWNTGCEYTLNLPFGQYQRYRMASDIIDKYRRPGQAFTILDVGASTGCILRKFLPGDTVYLMDIDYPAEYRGRGNYIVGDFVNYELKGQYDFVISMDTLEHVPAAGRKRFVEKLIEGSRIASILAAPFDTPGVCDCEARANETYRLRRGHDYKWLTEHARYGLPSLEGTLDIVKNQGFKYAVLPNGYLDRWSEIMPLNLLLADSPALSGELSGLSEYYNENFYPYDNREPSYRKVIVVAKGGNLPPFDGLITKDFEECHLYEKQKKLDEYISKIKEMPLTV